MIVRSLSRAGARIVQPALQTALVLLLVGPVAATSLGAAQDSSGSGRARYMGQQAGLDDRVDKLAQALGLDPRQRVELRRVLEHQHEQIVQLWSNTAMPAAYRISATQAISEQVADQIRALLDDEQKTKYNPPRPPRETLPGSGQPDVEDWMNVSQAKQAGRFRSPQAGEGTAPSAQRSDASR